MMPGSTRGQLDNPTPFPSLLGEQWSTFLELSGTGRTISPGGTPLPLSSLEIWAWCQLRRRALAPWELRLLRLLDVAWLEAVRKK